MLRLEDSLRVYSVVRMEYHDQTGNMMHFHDYYQLVYVRSGRGFVLVNEKAQPVQEGDLILIKRNEPHRLYADGSGFKSYELKFIFTSDDADFIRNLPVVFFPFFSDQIVHSIRHIEQEAHALNSWSRELVSSQLYVILMLLERFAAVSRSNDAVIQSADEGAQSQLIQGIRDYIAEHLQSDFSIQDVAVAVNHSYKYISRIFRKICGITLCRYITIQRIDMAKNMLENTESSISDIAASCGFTSVHQLDRTFLREEQMTPSQFRHRFRAIKTVDLETPPSAFAANTHEIIR